MDEPEQASLVKHMLYILSVSETKQIDLCRQLQRSICLVSETTDTKTESETDMQTCSFCEIFEALRIPCSFCKS